MKSMMCCKIISLFVLIFFVLYGNLAHAGKKEYGKTINPSSDRVQHRLLKLKNITRAIVNDIEAEKRLVENEIEILSKLDKANRPVAKNLAIDIERFQNLINEISGYYVESAKLLEEIEESYDVTLVRAKQLELEKFQRQVEEKIVDVKKTVTTSKDQWENIIIVGIDEEVYQKYLEYHEIIEIEKIISKYLSQYIDMEIALLGYRPIELEESYDNEIIDVLVTYSESIQQNNGLEGVLTAENNGKATQKCLLVTNEKSKLSKIEHLKGKTIAVLDRHIKKDLFNFFGVDFWDMADIKIASSNRSALMGLTMGEYDAIIGYENYLMDCDKKLKIIAQSSPIQNDPLFVKRSTNEKKNNEIDKLIECLKIAHRDKKIRELLKRFNVTQLVPYSRKQVHDEAKY